MALIDGFHNKDSSSKLAMTKTPALVFTHGVLLGDRKKEFKFEIKLEKEIQEPINLLERQMTLLSQRILALEEKSNKQNQPNSAERDRLEKILIKKVKKMETKMSAIDALQLRVFSLEDIIKNLDKGFRGTVSECTVEIDENGEKKKKPKRQTDEDAPKRNKSAFIHYIQAKRAEFLELNPTLNRQEVVKGLTQQYNDLTQLENDRFDTIAETDRQRYQVEREDEIEAQRKADLQEDEDLYGQVGKKQKLSKNSDQDEVLTNNSKLSCNLTSEDESYEQLGK